MDGLAATTCLDNEKEVRCILARISIVLMSLAVRHYDVSSTCYHQGSITASRRSVFVGEVANNFLALGTHIRLDRSVFGRRRFIVLDRIGWGSELDIYGPSEAACIRYGRQRISFTVVG